MMSRSWILPITISLLLLLLVNVKASEDDLFSDTAKVTKGHKQEKKRVAIEMGQVQFVPEVLSDLRLIQTQKTTNWVRGGRGLSRFGAQGNNKSGMRFVVPQASFVMNSLWKNRPVFYSHFQFNNDEDESGKIGVVEAYFRHEWNLSRRRSRSRKRFGKMNLELKGGIMIPPVSLEHPDVAWSTRYFVTPSAINTWIGEEVRVIGLQAKLSKGNYFFLVAPFSSNDPVGAILSWRGFALHDYVPTFKSRLSISPGYSGWGSWSRPFKEVDGKLGAYGQLGWKSGEKQIHLFYYWKPYEKNAIDGTDYSWETSFLQGALSVPLGSSVLLQGQYLTGQTEMGRNTNVKNTFTAWFTSLIWRTPSQSLALRYDNFEIIDKDNWYGWGVWDYNDQTGSALTFSYMYQLNRFYKIGLEYLKIDSERKAERSSLGAGESLDADDDLVQLTFRAKF